MITITWELLVEETTRGGKAVECDTCHDRAAVQADADPNRRAVHGRLHGLHSRSHDDREVRDMLRMILVSLRQPAHQLARAGDIRC